MAHIGAEAVRVLQSLHQFLRNFQIGFRDRAAFTTHQMNMLCVIRSMEGGAAMSQMGMDDQTRLLQCLEIAIDGGEIDARMRPAHMLGYRIRRGVTKVSNSGQHQLSLGSQAQATAANIVTVRGIHGPSVLAISSVLAR